MAEHLPNIAKNILPDQELNTVAYGCTSGTVAIGENIIANQIYKSKPNTYVTPIPPTLKTNSGFSPNCITLFLYSSVDVK